MKRRQKNKPSGVSRIPCSVGDVVPGRGRHKAAQVVIKRNPCRLRGRVCQSLGTLRGRSGEVVEMVGRSRLDFCRLQDTRWKGNGANCVSKSFREGRVSDTNYFGLGVRSVLPVWVCWWRKGR